MLTNTIIDLFTVKCSNSHGSKVLKKLAPSGLFKSNLKTEQVMSLTENDTNYNLDPKYNVSTVSLNMI